MEHLRDEQREDLLQRDEEREDQMEQIIYNEARDGVDVDDDFSQFLNDYGDRMESHDVVITNSRGEVYMCIYIIGRYVVDHQMH